MGGMLCVVKCKCRPFKGLYSHPLNTKYPKWSNSETLNEISPHASLRKAYLHTYTSPNKAAVSVCQYMYITTAKQFTGHILILHLSLNILHTKYEISYQL